jgi:hypothetical protein
MVTVKNNKKRSHGRRVKNWSFWKKAVYYAIIACLVTGVVKMYLLWWDNYHMLHPEIVAATAMEYVEELPLDGILVWDERVVAAPRDGVVTYPSPLPRRVAKGSVVAAIDGIAVKADTAGYFSPLLDGHEGAWDYTKLWLDFSQFPALKVPQSLEEGSHVNKGTPLGKLAKEPQDLYCFAYLDKTLFLEQDIGRGFIGIKTEPTGKIRQAEVRASWKMEQKIKVSLILPFFTPDILMVRTFSCKVLAGKQQGVAVPHSAVVLREGKLGVFRVQGSVTKFVQVEGFPADEDIFFVPKKDDGKDKNKVKDEDENADVRIVPGDIIVLNADKVKEGTVRIW